MSNYLKNLRQEVEISSMAPSPSYGNTHVPAGTNVYFRETGNPIPFTERLAHQVEIQVRKAFHYPYGPEFYNPPSMGSPALDGELKRFICALAAYFDPYSDAVMSKEFLFDGIKRLDFVDELKKIRFKSMVESFDNGRLTDHDEKYDACKSYRINDIGQIFNYRYWFFWSTEDPGDEQFSLLPLKAPTREQIDTFKEALRECLPESVSPVYEEEILLQVTGSGCIIPGTNLSSKVYISKGNKKHNSFSDKPLEAKLVYVQKCPGDTRRASVLSVPQSNSIKLIEKQTAIIAENTKDSIYVNSDNEFDKRMRRFKRIYNHFLCRDIRKDGLTKVRQFVTATLEVLEELYPDLPMHRYKGIYDNWTWWHAETPENRVQPPRGVGLGMSSAITTLMQAAHRRVVYKRMLDSDEHIEGRIEGLFYHDDAVIGFTDQGDLDTYDSFEDTYFEEIGLIKNKKKTFSANDFVICENYSNSFNDKKSYTMNLLYSVFAATNIVEAKSLLQQLVKYPCDVDINPYISKYVSYFGYEFIPEESRLPYRLGGWVPAEYCGVDTTFYWYDINTSKLHQSLMTAASHQQIEPIIDKKLREDDSLFVSPVEQLFGFNLDYGGYREAFYSSMPMCDLHRKMGNFSVEGSKAIAFNRLLEKRQKIFNKVLKTHRCMQEKDWYEMYKSFYPFKDILPVQGLHPERDLREYESSIGASFHTIETGHNNTISFLGFHNPDVHMFQKVIPTPIPPTVAGPMNHRRPTNEEHRLIARGPQFMSGTIIVQGRRFIPIQDCYNFLQTSWIDPYSVASAWQACHGLPTFPDVPPSGDPLWQEIIAYRQSNFHYWWKYTPYKREYQVLVRRLGWKTMNKEEYQCDEFIQELLQEIASQEDPADVSVLPVHETEPGKWEDLYGPFVQALKEDSCYQKFDEEEYREWESVYNPSVSEEEMDPEEEQEFLENFIEDDLSSQASNVSSQKDYILLDRNSMVDSDASYDSSKEGSLIVLTASVSSSEYKTESTHDLDHG